MFTWLISSRGDVYDSVAIVFVVLEAVCSFQMVAKSWCGSVSIHLLVCPSWITCAEHTGGASIDVSLGQDFNLLYSRFCVECTLCHIIVPFEFVCVFEVCRSGTALYAL
jgi:hypothetical protein